MSINAPLIAPEERHNCPLRVFHYQRKKEEERLRYIRSRPDV